MLDLNKIYNQDCLDGIKEIPEKSVNLVLIDPPYNIGKDKWDRISNYIEWMGNVFLECERVLKDNGSFYWFHNDFEQMCDLQQWLKNNTNFVFKSLITIDKLDNIAMKDLYGSQEHFRNYLNTNEYLLFYTFQKNDLDILNYYATLELQKILKKHREQKNLSYKDIGNIIGVSSTAVKHWIDYPTQPRFPNEINYNKLRDVLEIPYTYEEIQIIYKAEYEKNKNIRYTFNASNGLKNTWQYYFKKEKKYKHSTQKPLKLIEDIISYSSNEGDLVLDCFMGSGTTAEACVNMNRNFIGFEKSKEYHDISTIRIHNA